MQGEAVNLYYKQGGSDKVYQAQLVERNGGWVVNFQYGRRGSTLTSGTKTATPIEYAKAKSAYDKLVAEKKGKGYTEAESGSAYQATAGEARFTGILPQLLNAVEEHELEALLTDDGLCAQEKHDGERRLIRQGAAGDTAGVIGINRKGLAVALPLNLAEAFAHLPAGTVIDGEVIGTAYVAFDILEFGGKDVRALPYRERLRVLAECMRGVGPQSGACGVLTAFVGVTKRALLAAMRAGGKEGIVFKSLDAPYTEGCPNSGGAQLKFKLVESATVEVIGQNGTKRSVSVRVYDPSGTPVPVGSVTIPADRRIPATGEIVEVRYLYAYRDGALYQPVYLGERGDQGSEACRTGQLKYKAEVGEAQAA